ncbi:MAG: hypothetical protein PVJ72_06825 [Gammaproteobacteria bacterium]|jgi:hypothetical protein
MPQNPNKNNVIKIISGSRGQYPIKLGIIPGKLAVSVYLHYVTVGGKSVPCWSYVSDGFISLKQKELVFTLQSQEGEETAKFPMQPLQLFLLLYKHATQKSINIGDVIKLGEKGLFGFPALGCTFPQVEIPNAPFPRPTFATILLTKDEFLTAHSYGLTRVISRLGFEQKRYPCMPANARGRKSINWQPLIQNSQLKNIPRTPLKQASVYMFGGDQVVLNLPAAARTALANGLKKHPANKSLCLLLQLQPQHEGCLVWFPESNTTEMHMKVNASGESIAGSFILLEPGSASDGAAIVEDGFAMQFAPPSWQEFVEATAAGQFLQIHGSNGGMDFILTWGDQPLFTGQESGDQAESSGNIFTKLMKKFKK